MKTAVIEAVVILAAASAAFAGDYREAATLATDSAKFALCEAQSLPTLTPWPNYEYWRTLALSDAEQAMNEAAIAVQSADIADEWYAIYSRQMVMRATGQRWDFKTMADAKLHYDAARADSLNHSTESRQWSSLSGNAAGTARQMLAAIE
jgi:hypothetical protein